MEESKRNYTDRQMIYFLNNIEGIGNRNILKIYDKIRPLEKILYMKNEEILDVVNIAPFRLEDIREQQGKMEKMLEDMDKLKDRNIKFITFLDEDYPDKLLYIDNKPVCLYVIGEIDKYMFNAPTVAIVGSRATSNYGREMTRYIASSLANSGIDIVSGMAYGVDSLAHEEALKEGVRTYAVLGCGINICYPKENMHIYEAIKNTKRGAIISEFPLSMEPRSYNFPMRNRIISALSDLVIVIEAKLKSGSLITATCALEQGKEVYALPGRFTDAFSKGCNRLILDGAGIITSIDDIIESLGLIREKSLPLIEKNYNTLANNEKIVYSCLDFTPKHLEYIIEKTGLTYSEVISIILELEMRGFIKQISGNYYAKSCD